MSDLAPSTGETQDLDRTDKFDRDELVRGWREYEAQQPRCTPLFKYSAKTDMGMVRDNNEDKFDYYEPEDPTLLAVRGSLFAVSDGVGGAQAGQIASEMTLKSLISYYYDSPAEDIQHALFDSMVATNDKVLAASQMMLERNGMGSTLTAVVFLEDKVHIGQLGDSRAYLIREGQIRQMTLDHSWVEEQVRAGLMTREDAEMSPFRNVITRSIGATPNCYPDFFEEEARIGDIWVLCSDGLSNLVQDEELLKVAGYYAPSEATRQLIEIANSRGGRDNITVFVISIRGFTTP